MSTRRRGSGEGCVDQRGPDAWRIRYRVGGKRFALTVHGTKAAAQRELRRLLREGDIGEHVAPDKITLAQWVDEWLGLIRNQVTARTSERYRELLSTYAFPAIGGRRLQQLNVSDLDRLYAQLEGRVSAATVRHVHVAIGAALKVAKAKGHIRTNPAADASVPRATEPDVGYALTADELRRLLGGFRGTSLFSIVTTAALTGCRLGELLALRWSDLDVEKKTLRIERAIETTREYGKRLKGPKSKRGERTIAIGDDLVAMLLAERQRHLRIAAGVPDGVDVDLSLIRLPADALMFPSPDGGFDFTRLRTPRSTAREAKRYFRRLGFGRLRFHDLRGSHGTALLDAGVPIHVVAARLGHDPAVLLRRYARRNKQSDEAAAAVIAEIAKGAL